MVSNPQDLMIKELRESIEYYKKQLKHCVSDEDEEYYTTQINLLQGKLGIELEKMGVIPKNCPLYQSKE